MTNDTFQLRRNKKQIVEKFLSSGSSVDLANFKLANNELRRVTRDLRKRLRNGTGW